MTRPIITGLLTLVLLLGLSWVPHAFAQDGDQDASEDTMMVVEEGATPGDIVNVIELPTRASATARGNVGHGQDKADQAKELGKKFGQQIAEDAKSKHLGEHIRDDIQQSQRRDARGENGPGQRPDRD